MERKKGREKLPFGITILILAILLFLAMVAAACAGSANISIINALKLLLAKLPGIGKLFDISGIASTHQLIVYNLRLPRIILSGLVGMGLSITGAAFQGLFRNRNSGNFQ